MSVVTDIRNEVTSLKINGHLQEVAVDASYIRIMELLERQATIIEILGEIDPAHLKRFRIESYNPLS